MQKQKGCTQKKVKHPRETEAERQQELKEKHDIMEPVLDEKGNPCWLIIKTKLASTSSPKKPAIETIKENKPLEEKKIFELQPQGFWNCRKCGALIQSFPDPPIKCYEDQGGCGRKGSFKQFTKIINPDLWTLPEWKDIPNNKLIMKDIYKELLDLVKSLIVFSSEIEYKIYVLWIISTWKLESWDTVGFPIFIGIPESGKSRALRVISQLAYRAPKASSIRAAAVPRLTHFHNATILIDEAHNKLNPNTESGLSLLDFLKDSYKKGSVYISCDNNDQEKLKVTRNFGFKAIAGEKSFQLGLLSRGLIFYMDKGNPEITKLFYVEDKFKELRTKLLNYRYKTDNPPDLGNNFVLKGRIREIFEGIVSTGKHINVVIDDIINYAKDKEKRQEDELKESIQYEILSIIKKHQENPFLDDAPDRVKISDVILELGWENEKKYAIRLGYILKDMGLSTKKMSDGRCVFLQHNEERLNNLFRRYKLNEIQTRL